MSIEFLPFKYEKKNTSDIAKTHTVMQKAVEVTGIWQTTHSLTWLWFTGWYSVTGWRHTRTRSFHMYIFYLEMGIELTWRTHGQRWAAKAFRGLPNS